MHPVQRVFVAGLIAGAVLGSVVRVAKAAPPEPKGPHPRILLDASLRAAWQAALAQKRGPLVGALSVCDEDRTRRDHDNALYMGAEWAKMLQACLVAWATTGKPEYSASALKYFTALLDDLDRIGDAKGGDKAATRDSGYAIRNLGPYTAIAYDWLHDAPGMTPALRARARQRWSAWLRWYRSNGYHPRDPGSNYHAGFLLAATLIAIAQGGEAAEESGPGLWKFVADELWAKDMGRALAQGGVLDGGDWDEGWQYGGLSVAEYALAARVGKAHGLAVDGVSNWLGGVLRRHVHALTPGDRLWAGGDFDSEEIHMPPVGLALVAVAIGDANPDDKKWAKGELSRLKLSDQNYLLYGALATIGEQAELVPRESWPTWYEAAGTATLFTRTTWDDRAVWFVAACAQTNGLDHRSPNAGNFVLSRGGADVIVDPSPYGSLSTLTGNAPTVVSQQLPPNYLPSQGAWSQSIAWVWTTKTQGGVVAARCDYRDAYRFQDKAPDIAVALRDFVLLPSIDGHDASLVIVDRATTGDGERKMYLRFRVPGELAIDAAGTGTATIKDARLTITGAHKPTVGKTSLKDCFQQGTKRGNCDAARFPVTDYRVEVPGPEPRAVHVIDVGDAKAGKSAAQRPVAGAGWAGVQISGPRDAMVVWPVKPNGPLAYTAAKARPGMPVTHVVLDAPATDGKATVSARREGEGCAVTVKAGGSVPAAPLIVTLDEVCGVATDQALSSGLSAEGKPPGAPRRRVQPTPRRSGCCAAQSTPGSPLVLSLAVLALLVRRRWRR